VPYSATSGAEAAFDEAEVAAWTTEGVRTVENKLIATS
jgi:hypothetical protein